jgi:hypothetical protein
MKKAMLVGAALATLCISSAAQAVPSFQNRNLIVDGTGVTLSVLNFLPMGATGGFPGACLYQVAAINPFNPNDVQICQVAESRTNFAPSCIVNSSTFVNGAVLQSAPATCNLFDMLGVAHPTQLLVGESPAGLSGLAIETIGAATALYPVHA